MCRGRRAAATPKKRADFIFVLASADARAQVKLTDITNKKNCSQPAQCQSLLSNESNEEWRCDGDDDAVLTFYPPAPLAQNKSDLDARN